MKSKIFYNQDFHLTNLRENQEKGSFHDPFLLNTLQIKLPCKKTKYSDLREYTLFKDILISDLEKARIYLFNKKELIPVWNNKLLRFLEVRLSSLDERLKKNFPNKHDRIQFIQILISFLLESYFYSEDLRFLNIVLKIFKTSSNAKNLNKDPQLAVQLSYNILLVSHFLDLIQKNERI